MGVLSGENLAGAAPGESRSTAREMLIIVAFAALLNLPFLGQEWEWASREVRHAGIAAEMAENGDFLVPYLLGRPYVYKQPVLHAPVALLYRAFGGPSMLLARLPSALGGIALALLVYALGMLFYERRTAFLAALLCAATPGIAVLSRTARPDMLFSVALLAATWGLAAGMAATDARARAWRFALGGVAAGVAMLAKGPYGIVYPLLFAGTVYLLAPLGRPGFRRPRFSECLCFGGGLLLVPLAWVIPVYLRDDGAYLREVLRQHNAATAVHLRPIYYYLGPGLLHFLPWALLIPWVFIDAHAGPHRVEGRGLRAEAKRDERRWPPADAVPQTSNLKPQTIVSVDRAVPRMAAVIFLALSCVPSKRWHYLGPWYPFAALAVAAALARRWDARWLRRAAWSALAVVLIGVPLYCGVFEPFLVGRRNMNREFAWCVVRAVPPGSTILSFPGMAENLNFVRLEAAAGEHPRVRLEVVLASAAAPAPNAADDEEFRTSAVRVDAALRLALKRGGPCFVAANSRDLLQAADLLAPFRLTPLEAADGFQLPLRAGRQAGDVEQETGNRKRETGEGDFTWRLLRVEGQAAPERGAPSAPPPP